MGLISWIENSSFAEIIRVSAYGYPAMITLHSLGLAIMLGLSVMLALRVLGRFRSIPFSTLLRLLTIAWTGFAINLVSGLSLFAISATNLVRDPVFILKMTMVIAGAILVAVMQGKIKTALAGGAIQIDPTSASLKTLAWLSIGAWTIGMVTGRLIAYLPP